MYIGPVKRKVTSGLGKLLLTFNSTATDEPVLSSNHHGGSIHGREIPGFPFSWEDLKDTKISVEKGRRHPQLVLKLKETQEPGHKWIYGELADGTSEGLDIPCIWTISDTFRLETPFAPAIYKAICQRLGQEHA